jgi:microcystin-dependent protein
VPLESGSYIDDLNVSNPANSDLLSAADDHVRLIKSVLKNTFPDFDGPVEFTVDELNNLLTLIDDGTIPLAPGSLEAPSLHFDDAADTGLYLTEDGGMGLAIGGEEVLTLDGDGDLTVPNDITLEGNGTSAFGLFVPTGTVLDFAGSTAPNGYLLCYGQAVSRTTYAALFDVIGTAFGTGDGATTFNLPDYRGRVSAGLDNMGGTAANRLTGLSGGVDGATLGNVGGAQSHTLVTAQMPPHNHTFTGNPLPDHTHGVTIHAGGLLINNQPGTSFGGGGVGGVTNIGIQSASAGTPTGAISNTGSGQAHNNVQPTIMMNKIIKT